MNYKVMTIEPTLKIVKKDKNNNNSDNRQSNSHTGSHNSRSRPNKQSSFPSNNLIRTFPPKPTLSSSSNPKLSSAPIAPPKQSKNSSFRSPNSPDNQKKAMTCWICKSDQHWASKYPNRTRKLCYKCGYPDVIISTCPNCSPN